MPVEVPPIKPGQPSEPPQESPPGNPRPDVPVPAQNPTETPQPQELPGQTPQESPLTEPAGPRTYPATDQGISIFSEARRATDHARGAGRGIRRLARARAPDRGERLREGAERSESARRGGRHQVKCGCDDGLCRTWLAMPGRDRACNAVPADRD